MNTEPSELEETSKPKKKVSNDLSWLLVLINYVAMIVVVHFTLLLPEEMYQFKSILYALISLGVVAVISAVITGIFYIFRRKKESKLLKQSFVISSWFILAMVIWGRIS